MNVPIKKSEALRSLLTIATFLTATANFYAFDSLTTSYEFNNPATFEKTDWKAFNDGSTATINLMMIEKSDKLGIYNEIQVPWTITLEYADGSFNLPVLTSTPTADRALVFGATEHPIKKITLTTDYFDHKPIMKVNQELISKEGTEPQALFDLGNFTFNTYGRSVLSTGTVLLGGKQRHESLKIEYTPDSDDAEIILGPLSIDWRIEKDPELALPEFADGLYALPWQAGEITIPDKDETATFCKQLLSESYPEYIKLNVEPMFEPDSEPADISEELRELQKGKDAYYVYDAEAWFTKDLKQIMLKAPCSGKYRVTLKYEPTSDLMGYYPDEISREYDIYPVAEGIQMNGQDVVDRQVEISGKSFESVLINYKNVWGYSAYYQVSGSPQSAPEADGRTANVGQGYYVVPDDFHKYDTDGVDVRNGNTLRAHLVKNGAVGPLHTFAYTMSPDLSTGLDSLEADEAMAEYYTLTGLRVSREKIAAGIYIRRTPTSVAKVKF